jgi:hypothetical protein
VSELLENNSTVVPISINTCHKTAFLSKPWCVTRGGRLHLTGVSCNVCRSALDAKDEIDDSVEVLGRRTRGQTLRANIAKVHVL